MTIIQNESNMTAQLLGLSTAKGTTNDGKPPKKDEPAPCNDCGCVIFWRATSIGPFKCAQCHPPRRPKHWATIVIEPDGTRRLVNHRQEQAAQARRRAGEPSEAEQARTVECGGRELQVGPAGGLAAWWESLEPLSTALIELSDLVRAREQANERYQLAQQRAVQEKKQAAAKRQRQLR